MELFENKVVGLTGEMAYSRLAEDMLYFCESKSGSFYSDREI